MGSTHVNMTRCHPSLQILCKRDDKRLVKSQFFQCGEQSSDNTVEGTRTFGNVGYCKRLADLMVYKQFLKGIMESKHKLADIVIWSSISWQVIYCTGIYSTMRRCRPAEWIDSLVRVSKTKALFDIPWGEIFRIIWKVFMIQGEVSIYGYKWGVIWYQPMLIICFA